MPHDPATSAGRRRQAARRQSPGRLLVVVPSAESLSKSLPPRLPTEWRELHQGFGVRPTCNERLQRWHFTTLFTTRHGVRHPLVDDNVRVSQCADVVRHAMQRFGMAHLWYRILRNSRQVVRAKQNLLRCYQRQKENRIATLEKWLNYWNECEDRAVQCLREKLQTETERIALMRSGALPRALTITPPEVKVRVLWDLYWLLRLQQLRQTLEVENRLHALQQRLHAAREHQQSAGSVLAEVFVAFLQVPRQQPIVGRDITFKELLHLALSQDATNALLNSGVPGSPTSTLRYLRLDCSPKPTTPRTSHDEGARQGSVVGRPRLGSRVVASGTRKSLPRSHSEEPDLCLCSCHGTYVGFLSSTLCTRAEWLQRRHTTAELLVPQLTWTPDTSDDVPRSSRSSRSRRLTEDSSDLSLPALAGPPSLVRRRLRRSTDLEMLRNPSIESLPIVCPPPSACRQERRRAVCELWAPPEEEKVLVLARTSSGRCRRLHSLSPPKRGAAV